MSRLAAALALAAILPGGACASARQGDDFFNGKDLSGWKAADMKLWSVEEGAIVGHSAEPIAANQFIWGDVEVSDFYLSVEVKIVPNARNAGIQFRSRPADPGHPHGQAFGYQADVGRGVWGRLYHEHGRGALEWRGMGEKAVKPDEWNHYEILAVGPRIWTALNGTLAAALKDSGGERSGKIAFQIHAGPPQTVRYRILKLVHNPPLKIAGKTGEELEAALIPPRDAASRAPAGGNWPCFRGPTGQGLSDETGLPLRWGASSNVAWKTEIPGEGWSSPVVWGDRVFLTTAEEKGVRCLVLCLDRASGRVLWNRHVFDQVPGRKENKNSHATPTPCTDGERVYAVFSDGSVAALTFDGAIAWTNRDVRFYSRHGLGASPLLYRGLLIMPYDGSNRVEVAGQYPNNTPEERLGWQIPWDRAEIVALDVRTGERVWTARRGMSRVAHTTPVVLKEDGGDRILSIAGDAVQAFDPKTGERIWSVCSKGEGVVPSPALGEGLVFTASGFDGSTLRGIRTGGKGDVTATHIAWEQKKGVPMQPSLLYVRPYLYAVTDGGVATCYRPESGEIVWQGRVGERQKYSASPIHAEGRIYVLSESGETTVLAAGPEFKILARNPIGEKCLASPAAARGRLFIRSDRHLFCIGPRP